MLLTLAHLQISPQKLLHRKLRDRGYFPRKYYSKATGYYNKPTEHQYASYGPKIVDAIKRNQPNEFRLMLEAGLSPNACNEHGESLLHLICRHDKVELFRILIAFDVDLQQCDDYGRTPMHDACWASNPSFEIARCLLKKDPNFLFIYDDRGMHPLNYVTKSNWALWEDFLETCLDDFCPAHDVNKNRTPVLCTMAANSRPVPDPKGKIEATLANMVASGAMSAYDAIVAAEADEETTVACSEIDFDDMTSYYDSSDDEDYYDSTSDLDSDEEDELFEIFGDTQELRLDKIEEEE